MENHVLDIIDMIYTMIAEARTIPLSGDKCAVDRDKVLGLLDDLKAQLPGEIAEARRLMNARDEFVTSAKKEAESMRRAAEEEARAMLNKEVVVQNANRQAEETVRTAEKKSREILHAAGVYLDDALRQSEESVAATLDGIRQARAQFRAVSIPEPEGTSEVSMEDVEEMEGEDEDEKLTPLEQ